MSFEYIRSNLMQVKSEIVKACGNAGVDQNSVQLIGVTKTYEADIINASIEMGITDIAENRVQEIIRKYDAVVPGVKWHLIGHLQTNKVKYIIDKVDLIHSVDSLKLAEEIQKRAASIQKLQDVLIQINVADETQKFGIHPEDLPSLLEAISKMPNVRVCGLMNIAPLVDNPEELRNDFITMKKLFDALPDYGYENVVSKFLSMGMSNDFPIAIEEGSNMLRIGTSIYGKRK